MALDTGIRRSVLKDKDRGHTVDRTVDESEDAAFIDIGGAGDVTKSEKSANHQDFNQSILKNVELRGELYTMMTAQGGQIDPGEGSLWLVLADAATSISLGDPPSLPDDQIPPCTDVVPRRRGSDILIAVSYGGSDVNVSWPSNAQWGITRWTTTGPEIQAAIDGGSELEITTHNGPPVNPRPAGRVDLIRAVYMEAAKTWFLAPIVLGATPVQDPRADTPDEQPPAPGDPETEPDETRPTECPGASEDPATDGMVWPDTCAPIVYDYETGASIPGALSGTYPDGDVVRPPATGVGLLALSDSAVLVSANGGAKWLKIDAAPWGALRDAAYDGADRVVVVGSAGAAVSSDRGTTWRYTSPEPAPEDVSIELENPGFETGDLSGWTVNGEIAPSVSDALSPGQLPGSSYYVTNGASAGVYEDDFENFPYDGDGSQVWTFSDIYWSRGSGDAGGLRMGSDVSAYTATSPPASVSPKMNYVTSKGSFEVRHQYWHFDYASDDYNAFFDIYTTADGGKKNYIGILCDTNNNRYGLNVNGTNVFWASNGSYPAQVWMDFKIEFEIGPNGFVRLYKNGNLAFEYTGTTQDASVNTINKIRLGAGGESDRAYGHLTLSNSISGASLVAPLDISQSVAVSEEIRTLIEQRKVSGLTAGVSLRALDGASGRFEIETQNDRTVEVWDTLASGLSDYGPRRGWSAGSNLSSIQGGGFDPGTGAWSAATTIEDGIEIAGGCVYRDLPGDAAGTIELDAGFIAGVANGADAALVGVFDRAAARGVYLAVDTDGGGAPILRAALDGWHSGNSIGSLSAAGLDAAFSTIRIEYDATDDGSVSVFADDSLIGAFSGDVTGGAGGSLSIDTLALLPGSYAGGAARFRRIDHPGGGFVQSLTQVGTDSWRDLRVQVPADAAVQTARVRLASDDGNDAPVWFDNVRLGADTVPEPKDYDHVVRLGRRFVVIARDGSVYASSNGVRWSKRPDAPASDVLSAAVAGGAVWISDSAGNAHRSADLETWTTIATGLSAPYLYYDAGGVLAAGENGGLAVSSGDAFAPVPSPAGATGARLRCVRDRKTGRRYAIDTQSGALFYQPQDGGAWRQASETATDSALSTTWYDPTADSRGTVWIPSGTPDLFWTPDGDVVRVSPALDSVSVKKVLEIRGRG